jgi:hypothetical protein
MTSPSRNDVFWLRPLATFAFHDLVERCKVRAVEPLSERRGRDEIFAIQEVSKKRTIRAER